MGIYLGPLPLKDDADRTESCAWCGSARPMKPGNCQNCGGPRMIIDSKGAVALDMPKPNKPDILHK